MICQQKKGTKSSLIKCGGCGKSNTTYHQAQTRFFIMSSYHPHIFLMLSSYCLRYMNHIILVYFSWWYEETTLKFSSNNLTHTPYHHDTLISSSSHLHILSYYQICRRANDNICFVQRVRQAVEVLLRGNSDKTMDTNSDKPKMIARLFNRLKNYFFKQLWFEFGIKTLLVQTLLCWDWT